MEIKHENGLLLLIPQDLKHNKTPSGFDIFPEGGLDQRSPTVVSIEYIHSPLQDSLWKNKKQVEGKTVYYKESKYEGGSGGTEYTLETFTPFNKGYLYSNETVQSELNASPDFTLSWRVISQARYQH